MQKIKPLVIVFGLTTLPCLFLYSENSIYQDEYFSNYLMTMFKLRKALNFEPTLAEQVKIIVMDDHSTAHFDALDLDLDQWAKVIFFLHRHQPKNIVIDKLFYKQKGDAKNLQKALSKVKAPVQIGAFIHQNQIIGRGTIATKFPNTTIVQQGKSSNWNGSGNLYGGDKRLITHFDAIGNITYESYGKFRPFQTIDELQVPHLSLLSAKKVVAGDRALTVDGYQIQTMPKGFTIPNFHPMSSYIKQTINLKHVDQHMQANARLKELKKGDTIIIVPYFFTGNSDFVKSPAGKIPGGFMLAGLISNLLQRQHFTYFQHYPWLALSIILLTFTLMTQPNIIQIIGLICATCTIVAAGTWMFLENSLINFYSPLIHLSAVGITTLTSKQLIDIAKRTRRIYRLKAQLEKILTGTKNIADSKDRSGAITEALTVIQEHIKVVKEATIGMVLRTDSHDEKSQLIYLPLQINGIKKDYVAIEMGKNIKNWSPLIGTVSIKKLLDKLIVPITWQGSGIGLLVFEGVKVKKLRNEDFQFFETLSQSLALGLRNLEHQENLEILVENRTAALNEALQTVVNREAKIKAIMDHIDQGILTIDGEQKIEPEFSAFLPIILRTPAKRIANKEAAAVLLQNTNLESYEKDRISEIIGAIVGEDEIGWELNSSGLPAELTLQKKRHPDIVTTLDWKPMLEDGITTRLMVTMQDVTEKRRLKEEVKNQEFQQNRKMAAIGEMLAVDRTQLRALIQDALQRLEKTQSSLTDGNYELNEIGRDLHTIKGSGSTVGLKKVAFLAHEAESALKDCSISGATNNFSEKLAILAEEISFVSATFNEVFGSGGSGEGWSLHNFSNQVLNRIRAVSAAHDLNFSGLVIKDNIATWSDANQKTLIALMPHCINNALDHGYINPKNSGKKVRGIEIELSAHLESDRQIHIHILDRGFGINHSAVKKLAKDKGVPIQKYLEVLFLDGSSTAETVTLTSGRGVGLSAVRNFARENGGDMRLRDRQGGGTVVEIVLPAADDSEANKVA